MPGHRDRYILDGQAYGQRDGRTLADVAREFELSDRTLRNSLKQGDVNVGRREDGLTTTERDELTRLRRENKRLQVEQEIPKKAAAWFAPLHENPSHQLSTQPGLLQLAATL